MKSLKNIIKNTLAATAISSMALASVSCDDLLDTKPQGSFTDEQVGDEEAIDLMTSAYATLLCHYFGNNESFAGPINNWVFDVRSDDALKGGDGVTMEGYMHQLEVGNVQSDNDIANFKWRNNYYSISRCNTAIRAILNSSSISDQNRASFVAEMKTLRAYYYFDMLRIFKKFPYFDENVVDPSGCRADEYTRDQIAEFIKADLRESYYALPETQAQVGRFNRYVAAAILARVDLFTSSWAEAEEFAGYVIASGQYELYPNFLDMSKPEYNNMYESVMAIQFSSANSPDQFNFNNCLNCTWSEGNLYGNGDDFYLASQNLVNAFRTDENGLPYLDGSFNNDNIDGPDYPGNVDPRLDFTLGRIGMPWRGHMYNEKWCRNLELYGQYSGKKPYTAPESPYCTPGIVPWGASSLNWSLIRYADVMLMKAEALIEQNKNLDEARALINEIRKKAARSVDPSYTPVDCNPNLASYLVSEYPASGWNQDYARRAVRMERRIELAMEGHRWFDLVRWGNVVQTMNDYYASEVKIHSYYQGANLTEDEVYLPIPINQYRPMKRIPSYMLALLTVVVCGLLSSCSDYEPKGYPEVPALATASDLQASVAGRSVTLTWQLPSQQGITAVRVSRDNGAATILPADATSCTLKGQPMDQQLVFTVKVEYDNKYVSEGVSVIASVPYVASKMAYLMTAPTIADLPDDDERAAATWFAAQENAEFIQPSQISSLDPDIYSVIWIEIDRVGMPMGWQNLPAEVSSDATIAALREYSANGGSLYLANMATQLTLPLGFVPEGMEPTVYGNGNGGTGDDVWVINPYLGWDFRDGSDQGFYDRTSHAIFNGLTLEDPNGYGYNTLPLIGPGMREDHNCLWDCNIYGKGDQPDVIKNFEVTTNSQVLATWGHVRDHCVAGLVDFYAAGDHGRCVANGFAAYEWNQNSGANPYQGNVEKLTLNILHYLQ